MIVDRAEDIFSKIHKEDFVQLIHTAHKYEDIPEDTLIQEYQTGNHILDELQTRWVSSLDNGNPDYSVYSAPEYMNESFVCWKNYARRYIKLLHKYISSENCELDVSKIYTILDLGCGCGYSTVGLKAVFQNAVVIGTNLKGTLQYKIDEDVMENIDGCTMVDDSDTFNLPSVDMVFASEFFEHLTEPINFLNRLITTYNPEYIVFANTFGPMSIGHFNTYIVDGETYNCKEIPRMFSSVLREYGYEKVQTGFFNNRPAIYKKKKKLMAKRLFEVLK